MTAVIENKATVQKSCENRRMLMGSRILSGMILLFVVAGMSPAQQAKHKKRVVQRLLTQQNQVRGLPLLRSLRAHLGALATIGSG
jgi:hypothetical protein